MASLPFFQGDWHARRSIDEKAALMRFDWPAFLKQRGIPYVTSGPNTARGNISIRCPFCGDSDHSQHLGISLEGRGWSCWRNRIEHRGIRPHRLIQALIGCSYPEAAQIVGDVDSSLPAINDNSFGDHINALIRGAPQAKPKPVKPLIMAPEIRPLIKSPLGHQQFRKYLHARKYSSEQIAELFVRYDLHGAFRGAFRYRMVFPVSHPEGLVCWTGRSILAQEGLRYKALSADERKAKLDNVPVARLAIHSCLWQAEKLYEEGGDMLVIVEGPFDAMRVDFLGREFGIRATCVFGKHVSVDQIALLVDIAPKFKHHVLLLDPDAFFESQGLVTMIEPLGFRTCALPHGLKDPAMLEPMHGLGFLYQ